MNGFQRPLTFEDNEGYFLHEHDAENQLLASTRVIFVTYAPCPAFVIVQNEDGKYVRCSRDDLFVLRNIPD
jgi:hypothetical protein